MNNWGFNEFVDKKERKARKHLGVVKDLLEKSGFQVTDKLEERSDPYLYVYNPEKNKLSFEGVRVYAIGGNIAYRVQKEAHTHPFGKAYLLPIEDMFEDLLGEDDMDDEKLGKEIIESVIKEIKQFFTQSFEAERKGPTRQDPLGKVHMRSSGTDYSNTVTDNTR